MTTTSAIQFLNALSEEYDVKINGFTFYNQLRSGLLASVGRDFVENENGRFFRDGRKMSRAESGCVVSISNQLLNKSYSKIEAVLTHEFAHVLQYNKMTNEQLKELRTSPATEEMSAISSYAKNNWLEGDAEVFTFTRLGYTNHTKIL